MSVELDTEVPARFDRSQLALRVLLAIVFGWFGITLGWMTSLLYILLPTMAAAAISVVIVLAGADMPGAILAYQRGVLRWQLRLLAYLASLVAEYPPWHLHGDVHHPEAVAL